MAFVTPQNSVIDKSSNKETGSQKCQMEIEPIGLSFHEIYLYRLVPAATIRQTNFRPQGFPLPAIWL